MPTNKLNFRVPKLAKIQIYTFAIVITPNLTFYFNPN